MSRYTVHLRPEVLQSMIDTHDATAETLDDRDNIFDTMSWRDMNKLTFNASQHHRKAQIDKLREDNPDLDIDECEGSKFRGRLEF